MGQSGDAIMDCPLAEYANEQVQGIRHTVRLGKGAGLLQGCKVDCLKDLLVQLLRFCTVEWHAKKNEGIRQALLGS